MLEHRVGVSTLAVCNYVNVLVSLNSRLGLANGPRPGEPGRRRAWG